MGVAIGYESQVAFGMQTAFGAVATPTITASHLRAGPIFSPRQAQMPRQTTAATMPRASQLWRTMGLVDFSTRFEMIFNDTVWRPLFTAAFKKRVSGTGPFIHTYTVNNPPIDGGVDNTPPNNFYDHGLTIRHTLLNVATFVVQDCCVDRFQMVMEANKPLEFELSGVGQKMAVSSPISFVDVAGTLATWEHLYATANSGLYVGAANPPTTAIVPNKCTFALDNKLRFAPFLGTPTGLELKLPVRTDYPTARFEFDMDFDDVSATDAVSLMTDYLTLPTPINENLQATYYVDATHSIQLKATGSVKPGVIDQPSIKVDNNGPVGFGFGLNIFPDTIGDLAMVHVTAA